MCYGSVSEYSVDVTGDEAVFMRRRQQDGQVIGRIHIPVSEAIVLYRDLMQQHRAEKNRQRLAELQWRSSYVDASV